jgi:hypothetical protein
MKRRPTAPLARQFGTGKRRRKKARKPDRRRIGEVNERLPAWIILQAEKAQAKKAKA